MTANNMATLRGCPIVCSLTDIVDDVLGADTVDV